MPWPGTHRICFGMMEDGWLMAEMICFAIKFHLLEDLKCPVMNMWPLDILSTSLDLRLHLYLIQGIHIPGDTNRTSL
jgi:hypothetical protein